MGTGAPLVLGCEVLIIGLIAIIVVIIVLVLMFFLFVFDVGLSLCFVLGTGLVALVGSYRDASIINPYLTDRIFSRII